MTERFVSRLFIMKMMSDQARVTNTLANSPTPRARHRAPLFSPDAVGLISDRPT